MPLYLFLIGTLVHCIKPDWLVSMYHCTMSRGVQEGVAQRPHSHRRIIAIPSQGHRMSIGDLSDGVSDALRTTSALVLFLSSFLPSFRSPSHSEQRMVLHIPSQLECTSFFRNLGKEMVAWLGHRIFCSLCSIPSRIPSVLESFFQSQGAHIRLRDLE